MIPPRAGPSPCDKLAPHVARQCPLAVGSEVVGQFPTSGQTPSAPHTSGVIAPLARPVDDARGRATMRRYVTGDVWTDAKLLHAEERMAEARAVTARRACLRASRPPRRGVRRWLGWVLLAAGHRLLG